MTEDLPLPENFSGVARLFPLPNLVLFPYVLQGLHVFEPRYRQLTADALADDRLISLVLLQPGWEKDYEGRPPLARVGCLGRVVADQQLPDGRYNLQLRGLSRFRVVEEIDNGKLYRSARVELLSDQDPPAAGQDAAVRRALEGLLPPWCPGSGNNLGLFRKLLRSALPLGTVCDVLAYALPIPVAAKQELLEMLAVRKRADRLAALLRAGNGPPPQEADERPFPPPFSPN
jgi:Lon protease-like protein